MRSPDQLDIDISRVVRGYEVGHADIWGNPNHFAGMREQLRALFDTYLRKAAEEWQKQPTR